MTDEAVSDAIRLLNELGLSKGSIVEADLNGLIIRGRVQSAGPKVVFILTDNGSIFKVPYEKVRPQVKA